MTDELVVQSSYLHTCVVVISCLAFLMDVFYTVRTACACAIGWHVALQESLICQAHTGFLLNWGHVPPIALRKAFASIETGQRLEGVAR